MTWIKMVPMPHDCRKPVFTTRIGHGSIWKCDHCGQDWMLLRDNGMYWKKATVYA